MKLRLSKLLVQGLEYEPPPGRADRKRLPLMRVWDSARPGVLLVIYPSGEKVLQAAYSINGRERRATVGRLGSLEGRDGTKRWERMLNLAAELLLQVRAGRDPLGEREAGRRAERDAPTVADVWRVYLEEHGPHWRPSTAARHRSLWKSALADQLGPVKAKDLSRRQVEAWHRTFKDSKPVLANRSLSLLRAALNHAIRRGDIPGPNPAAGVRRFREKSRERFLRPEEVRLLFAAIEEEERRGGGKRPVRVGEAEPGVRGGKGTTESDTRGISRHAAALLRLLVYTGARKSEIMGLKWEEVDFERVLLRLGESKTGQKVIHLSAPALKELARLHETRSGPWVIEGAVSGQPMKNPARCWSRVQQRALKVLNAERKKAEQPPIPAKKNPFLSIRVHDLRHSFASFAVDAGESLFAVGKALGHSDQATTGRYAHLADDPIRKVHEAVGRAIAAALAGKSAKVEDITAPPTSGEKNESGSA